MLVNGEVRQDEDNLQATEASKSIISATLIRILCGAGAVVLVFLTVVGVMVCRRMNKRSNGDKNALETVAAIEMSNDSGANHTIVACEDSEDDEEEEEEEGEEKKDVNDEKTGTLI